MTKINQVNTMTPRQNDLVVKKERHFQKLTNTILKPPTSLVKELLSCYTQWSFMGTRRLTYYVPFLTANSIHDGI